MAGSSPWSPSQTLGAFIRSQRQLADFSLRELAALTDVSNAYLSQVERGLHQPSVRVLTAIAQALDVSPNEMLAEAGLRDAAGAPDEACGGQGRPAPSPAVREHVCSTAEAIAADPRLGSEQRRALLAVYRSFVPEPDDDAAAPPRR